MHCENFIYSLGIRDEKFKISTWKNDSNFTREKKEIHRDFWNEIFICHGGKKLSQIFITIEGFKIQNFDVKK